MVLAAGKGLRLRPLTDRLPKPMVPVLGRPMLEYVVEALRGAGIVDIVVNVHQHGDAVQAHFGSGERFGVRLRYSREPELLGTAGAVKQAEADFLDTFVVYYGDTYVEVDLQEMLSVHRARRALGTIAVFHAADPSVCGVVELDEAQRIRRFVEKPAPGTIPGDLANAGVYILEPQVVAAIPPRTFSDFGRDIFPELLRQGAALYAYPLRGQVIGMDTLEGLRRLETYLTAS